MVVVATIADLLSTSVCCVGSFFTGTEGVFFIDCRLRRACRKALLEFGTLEVAGADPLATLDSKGGERAFIS